MRPMDGFAWGTKLGVAVVLFVVAGGVHLLIGVLTPIVLPLMKPGNILLLSERSDSAAYGRSSAEWMEQEPELRTYRNVMIYVIAGLLVAAGTLELLLTWFGVRAGMTWALAGLTIVGVVTIAFWLLALGPYFRAGAPIGLQDLPPFMWVPSLAYPPAIALAWWSRMTLG
jgi:hypothetical protein